MNTQCFLYIKRPFALYEANIIEAYGFYYRVRDVKNVLANINWSNGEHDYFHLYKNSFILLTNKQTEFWKQILKPQ